MAMRQSGQYELLKKCNDGHLVLNSRDVRVRIISIIVLNYNSHCWRNWKRFCENFTTAVKFNKNYRFSNFFAHIH